MTQHEMLQNGVLNTLAIYFNLLAKEQGWATDRTFMLNKSAPAAAREIASVLYVLTHAASDGALLSLEVVEEATKNNQQPVLPTPLAVK